MMEAFTYFSLACEAPLESPSAESQPSDPAHFRSLPTSDASSGLPQAMTSFIGRDDELAAVQSLLASNGV